MSTLEIQHIKQILSDRDPKTAFLWWKKLPLHTAVPPEDVQEFLYLFNTQVK